MTNYRDQFYSKYVSAHAGAIYGEVSLESIRSQYGVWQSYFGKFLPKEKSARVLDIGCGNGNFVFWFQELGYTNASGIDVSLEQVEAAERLGIKNISQADIVPFLNERKGEYDLIVGRDILEHFSEADVLPLSLAIFEAVKPGGCFVSQTVNAGNLLWGRFRYGDFTHGMAFTEGSIKQLMGVVGFSRVAVYPMGPVVHGFKSFARFILWKLIEWKLRLYVLAETGSSRGIFTQNIITGAWK